MASEERSTQDIAQPRRTTSTSTKQPSLATMPIKDADQSSKNPQVAAELNMLRQLSIDDNIQSPKKSEDKTPGRVDPIPANIIARGATGNKVTSGFSAPAFGQTVTPIKNSSFTSGRNSKFDNISSNEPSFGALAKSGGTAFGNSQTSNPSIGAFGSGIPSDQRNISAKSSIKTKSSRFADDGNSENPKQRGDKSLGQENPLGFVDTSLDELPIRKKILVIKLSSFVEQIDESNILVQKVQKVAPLELDDHSRITDPAIRMFFSQFSYHNIELIRK